jgi:hypothetical protein
MDLLHFIMISNKKTKCFGFQDRLEPFQSHVHHGLVSWSLLRLDVLISQIFKMCNVDNFVCFFGQFLIVTTLALGSWPRQGLLKVRTKSEAYESHFMLPGVWESVREWTSTLPNELPLWELESQWTYKFLDSDCKGQSSLDWRLPYIIGKVLEFRCLKWARMTHWGTWNTSYDQKKGRESNLTLDH